jgi:hypothetical protein
VHAEDIREFQRTLDAEKRKLIATLLAGEALRLPPQARPRDDKDS